MDFEKHGEKYNERDRISKKIISNYELVCYVHTFSLQRRKVK